MPTNPIPAQKRAMLEAGTYDVPEVAELLKCSERHVRNMAESGSIPGIIRFGRLLRFHRGLLNEWLVNKAKGVADAN